MPIDHVVSWGENVWFVSHKCLDFPP